MEDNCLEHQYVKEALSLYDFKDPEAILLRHNENETYKVTDRFTGYKYNRTENG